MSIKLNVHLEEDVGKRQPPASLMAPAALLMESPGPASGPASGPACGPAPDPLASAAAAHL